MKFLQAYSNTLFYKLSPVKIKGMFLLFCLISFYKLSAQDSFNLHSFTKSNLPYSNLVLKQPGKFYSLQPLKEKTYLAGQKNIFSTETASINDRYKPVNNPLLIWKYDYPLTAQEMERRLEQKKLEEKPANQVLKTIFSKKKNNKPVIPAF